MRDLLVSLFVLGSLPFCFRRPFIGLLMFTLLAYMRVQDLTWGFARYVRWSYFVAIVMLVGFLFMSGRKRLFVQDARSWIMIALIVLIGISLVMSNDFAWERDSKRYIEYMKIVLIALFTTSVVRNRDQLRILVLVIALSFGFFGFKGGLAGLLSAGRMKIIEGPGGMISDNNDFAMALCMAIPLLLHLGLSEKRLVLRRILLTLVPMTMVTVILTYSRGAFLSMTCMWIVLIWRSANRVGGYLVMGLVLIAGVIAAPSGYKDRISTISTYDEDASAMGRLHAWRVALNMVQARPLTGVGFEKFQPNYPFYDFAKDGGRMGTGKKVAHNSYLQIWAECGTPALLLYLALIVLSFADIWRTRKQARERYHASWILSYATMFEASMVAFVVGSTFLNRAHFDLFYHFVAIILMWGVLAREAMQDEVLYPRRTTGTRGPLTVAPRRGFESRRLVDGFARSPAAGAGGA